LAGWRSAVPAGREFPVGGISSSVACSRCSSWSCSRRRKACSRRHRAESLDDCSTASSERSEAGGSQAGSWRATLPHIAPFAGMLALALILPLIGNDYWR